ncbi:hypothetical protein F7R13_11610 [Burkholderia territorii]|uniref:Uncharacterized protein n=1 Tax=Burkholderia territorii TaxID=1503055 RepID=A0A6L3NHY4_9BURK|nr:hypothetical protein F7R13_11610 [Burkholderia territorii]
MRIDPLRGARHRSATSVISTCRTRYRNNAREAAILEMPACRVLARLRISHDDFSTYQGYLRYAEIVAGHASNAQDARIFAT